MDEVHDDVVSSAATRFLVLSFGSVTYDLPSAMATITLQEEEAPWRPLTIPVALPEAISISQAVSEQWAPRPNTHDLFIDYLRRTKTDVIAARITREDGGIFFAEIDLMTPQGRVQLPCRPSDAIAMAVRQTVPAPILCTPEVIESQN
jgi:bifunctional DNase/RNase